MAESVDCSDFCRLCLVKEQVNTPIFEELGDLQQIYIKITACLPIKVSLEDPLPKRICDECSYKLDQQYNFWNTSINAEKQLRQWLGLPEEPPTKSENVVSGKIKREKDNYESPSKRPRRNARRKAAQHVRQAAAAAIAASDSGPGEDMDLDAFTKEENDSDNDFHDNNESMEDSTYANVGLDSEEHGEAGPSGLQKGAVTSTNSGTDAGGPGVIIKNEIHAVVNVDENKWTKPSTQDNPGSETDTSSDEPYVKPYKCRYCKIDCKTEQMFTINDKTMYRCKICAKEYLTERSWHTDYHRHLLSKKYACDECNNCFTYRIELTRHKRLNHTDELICEICNKKCTTNRNLRNHMNRVHLHLQMKKYKCDLCENTFSTNKDREIHLNRDHYGSKYECDICHKEFRSPKNIAFHKRSQHDPNYVGKKYACDVCNKEYASSGVLQIHKRKHTGSYIVCHVCGKGFLSLHSLKLHASIHTNLKPYACKTCGKEFRNKPLLRNHERIHTGEKPYRCNICEKRFTQRGTLTIHLRGHNEQQPNLNY